MTEETLVLHALQNILVKHFLADHSNLFLVGRDPLSQPVKDLLPPAAHGVLPEPPILVVFHLDVFVHNEGPLLQVF